MTAPRGVTLLGILAVVSLALNLFLAGGLLGRHFHRPPPGHEFDSRLATLWRGMPEADQNIAREIIAQHHEQLITKWRASRTAGLEAALALKATPFEADDAKAELTKWNARSFDFRDTFHATLIEIASKISPEGRARLHFGPPR